MENPAKMKSAIESSMKLIQELETENKRLQADNEALNSRIGKFNEADKQYSENLQQKDDAYAKIDADTQQIKIFIRALAGRYEKLENTLKEKDGKIKGLEKELAGPKDSNEFENIDLKIDLARAQGETIEHKINLEKAHEKITRYAGKIRNLKYAAIILGMLGIASAGYIAYQNYQQVQKK